MTFSLCPQFESDRTIFASGIDAETITFDDATGSTSFESQDSFELSNNFESPNDVVNNNNQEQTFENAPLSDSNIQATSPSSPRGIAKKKRKSSKNSFIDFPTVITCVSNTNSSPTEDDMWMQGVLFQFKHSCLCSSYSSSYSIKQKKPSNNSTTNLVSNRRTV